MLKEKEELSSVTLIKDPKMEPYFIGKDAHCYTIYVSVTPDVKYTTDNKPGKNYTKVIGHYSTFGNCLKGIARNKVNDKKNYDSIKEYIESFKAIQQELNKLIDLGI
jgi:hypothetical protein